MRWTRRKKADAAKVPNAAARRAVDQAEAARTKATGDNREIIALSDRLRTLREENHFADLIRAAISGEGHAP